MIETYDGNDGWISKDVEGDVKLTDSVRYRVVVDYPIVDNSTLDDPGATMYGIGRPLSADIDHSDRAVLFDISNTDEILYLHMPRWKRRAGFRSLRRDGQIHLTSLETII